MKKLYALILVTVLAGLLFGVTETHRYKESVLEGRPFKAFKKVTITQTGTPPADFTETLDDIWGVIDTIVIDATGDDTSYKIYLKDSAGNTLFSKVDCTTASDPMRYAVSESDTGSTEFRGARVAGQCTVEMADGDDSSLTAITVTLYYWMCWQ